MHALVVDDSRAMRKIIGQILKEYGFEITEAGNGKEALERLKALGHADLATVDWNMPEMNGFEFVQAVRADPVYDQVRLLMVTTETETTQVSRALHAGATEYLMKPFGKEAIADKLTLMGMSPQSHG